MLRQHTAHLVGDGNHDGIIGMAHDYYGGYKLQTEWTE
jgi:hypothetical protein